MTTAIAKTLELEPILAGGSGDKWRALLDGALAGAFDLPEHVVRAVVSYNRIHSAGRAASAEAARFPVSWRQAAISEAARGLARAYPSTLDGDAAAPIIALERQAETVLARREVLAAAADESSRLLDGCFLGSEEPIIACLSTGLDETLEAVRKLPDDLPRSAAEALDATPAQVAAYRAMLALVERHEALRRAQRCLRDRIPTKDDRGLFTDSPLGPEGDFILTVAVRQQINRPGPEDPRERLVWLAGPGKGWLPTAGQQTAAFEAWAAHASRPRPLVHAPMVRSWPGEHSDD